MDCVASVRTKSKECGISADARSTRFGSVGFPFKGDYCADNISYPDEIFSVKRNYNFQTSESIWHILIDRNIDIF